MCKIAGGIFIVPDWQSIGAGWQAAFTQAWQAYCRGSVPIGAAILTPQGEVAASSGNHIYDRDPQALFFGHTMAHAELNAIMSLNEFTDHPGIRTYALYTTMEPCPLCFGAIVMGSIRSVRYAASDPVAGAAAINGSLEYIRNKRISVSGPEPGLDIVQVALMVDSEIARNGAERARMYLDKLRITCLDGVELGLSLHAQGVLAGLRAKGAEAAEVYGVIAARHAQSGETPTL